jgi:hypothetical protein
MDISRRVKSVGNFNNSQRASAGSVISSDIVRFFQEKKEWIGVYAPVQVKLIQLMLT